MRPLSLRQAHRCESSENGRCRCRCGGALHGAKRGLNESFFRSLPDDDPHKATERREKQARPKPQMRLFGGGVMPDWAHYADDAAVELARARLTLHPDHRMEFLKAAFENIGRAIAAIEEQKETHT